MVTNHQELEAQREDVSHLIDTIFDFSPDAMHLLTREGRLHILDVSMGMHFRYGELTGLSKQMVKQRHGAEQFKAWRRGYKIRYRF